MTDERLYYIIPEDAFRAWVRVLIDTENLIGPTQNLSEFIFAPIHDLDELCLDYPGTTLTTPAQVAFSQGEPVTLVTYEKVNGRVAFSSAPPPGSQLLFGVHPYDIHGIKLWVQDRMGGMYPDRVFAERLHTLTIVGLDVRNPPPESFCASMGTHTADEGYDIMLTYLDERYVVEIATERGRALFTSAHGFTKATDADLVRRDVSRNDVAARYPYTMPIPLAELHTFLTAHKDHAFFTETGAECIGCGKCTTPVCPTCTCCNKQSEPNLGGTSGYVVRVPSSCQTVDFTRTADGSSARNTAAEWRRHWLFDKLAYPHGTEPIACVGCGRCGASACLPDIAHPVRAVLRLQET